MAQNCSNDHDEWLMCVPQPAESQRAHKNVCKKALFNSMLFFPFGHHFAIIKVYFSTSISLSESFIKIHSISFTITDVGKGKGKKIMGRI